MPRLVKWVIYKFSELSVTVLISYDRLREVEAIEAMPRSQLLGQSHSHTK